MMAFVAESFGATPTEVESAQKRRFPFACPLHRDLSGLQQPSVVSGQIVACKSAISDIF
jgi:hypothetical protein